MQPVAAGVLVRVQRESNPARPPTRDERAGGTWEKVHNADGSLAGFRCVFPNGDQIYCDKDWTDPRTAFSCRLPR